LAEFSWAYASGRIKIVEKELLPGSALRQLADAKTLEAAIAFLHDTCYGRHHMETQSSPTSFDLPLHEALSDAYDSVLSFAGEPLAVTVFRARHDFHNVKVTVKHLCLGVPFEEEALSTVGNLDAPEIEALLDRGVIPGTETGMPSGTESAEREDILIEEKALVSAYLTARDLVEREKASCSHAALALLADGSVDASYYGWASSLLKKLGYPELSGFLAAEVDLLNLRMAVRATRCGIPASLFRQIVLSGGGTGESRIRDAYGLGLGEVEQMYSKTPWAGLAASGVARAKRGESLTTWEKECDDALIRVYKRARYIAMGPEPVVGYLLGKEAEVRNLRVILAGKQSQLPPAEILERLRETYA
jgi:V/A-type H+-transporting ATPase subunit C